MTKDTRNKGFFYKYLVKRRDKGQFDWEKVHKKDGTPEPVNRYFLVPQNERSLTGLYLCRKLCRCVCIKRV